MRTYILSLGFFLLSLLAQAQGPVVRRADTLQQVLAIDPTKVASSSLAYLVMGRTSVNDNEVMIVDWDATNSLAANGTTIFTNVAAAGRWVVRPVTSLLVLSPTNFAAGTGLSVVVTNNQVTYTLTSTSTPSTFTINGQSATNIWNNGLIVPSNGGSGANWSFDLGNETVGTNKISVAFYEWLLSNFGTGGGTTNGFGVNGTYRTDWNFLNSAAIVATVSGGTNWYLSIPDASISTNKIDGTFRAWVESMGGGGGTNYTQFYYDLTNSIVASNNVSIAYGSGKLFISATGSGGGDVYLANIQTFTGASNIFNGDVYIGGTLYVDDFFPETLHLGTNLVARANGGTGADTSAYGVGLFGSNGSNVTIDVDTEAELETAVGVDLIAVVTDDITSANLRTALSDETGTGAAVFVGGDLGSATTATTASAGASNTVVATTAYVDRAVASSGGGGGGTTDNVIQWIGSAYFVITNNSTTGDFSLLQTNGIVTSASVIDGQNDTPVVIELGFPTRSTNYLWTAMFEEDVSGNVAYESEGGRTTTSLRLKMHNAGGSIYFTGGYWVRIDLYDKTSVSGGNSGGGDPATQTANYVYAGPTNGSPAIPAFRPLVEADIPSSIRRPKRTRLILFEKDWVTLTPANSALPELVGTAVSSGSATVIASESNHLGLLRLSSSTTSNSAYYFLSSILGLFSQPVLTWESISRVRATNSGVSVTHGFTDSATIANPTDAIRLWRSNNFIIPQIWYNGALTQGYEYPIQSNQFVYLKFQVKADMTNVTFYAEDSDTKTLILSTNLTATLPADSNRSFGVGHLAASTNAVALTLEDLDWSTAYIDGEVNR